MSIETTTAVLEVHRLAVQQDLTRALKSQDDWDRFNAIARQAAERLDAERADFQHGYQDRLSEARQAILREQNGRPLEPPKPGWGRETPIGPDRLEILAQTRVQTEHTQYIAAIRREEIAAYRAFRVELREREDRRAYAHARRKDHARDAFNRTQQHPDLNRSR